jgi:hypothetical protein
MKRRKFRDAVADLVSPQDVGGKRRGELYELFEVKNLEEFKDELSDIAYGIGRLVAGIFGRNYVRVPGDTLHYEKIAARMAEYGCIRSKRFLVEGRCPSE